MLSFFKDLLQKCIPYYASSMPLSDVFSISIQPQPIQCDIEIGKNLFSKALRYMDGFAPAFYIITTKEIADLLPASLALLVLPSGESIKSRAIKEKLEDFLIEKGAGKECALLAIGGGSLLDLVGFVASTYCRGIPFVSMPTTLLAMTDAAIGGKTAVNVSKAKNWIGSFYFPKKIFIDLDFLLSLPKNEFLFGLAETVKHSLIADASFFSFLDQNCEKILAGEPEIIAEAIGRSCMIKKKVVEEDPYETKGLRRILNFGHTIGHALESQSGYQKPHGEAVFMGMLAESTISYLKGYLSLEHWKRISHFIKKLALPLEWPEKVPFESLQRDKKGAHRVVCLQEIGSAASFDGTYTLKLTEKDLDECWEYVSCHH